MIALGGGAVESERVREALAGHLVVWCRVDEEIAWQRAAGIAAARSPPTATSSRAASPSASRCTSRSPGRSCPRAAARSAPRAAPWLAAMRDAPGDADGLGALELAAPTRRSSGAGAIGLLEAAQRAPGAVPGAPSSRRRPGAPRAHTGAAAAAARRRSRSRAARARRRSRRPSGCWRARRRGRQPRRRDRRLRRRRGRRPRRVLRGHLPARRARSCRRRRPSSRRWTPPTAARPAWTCPRPRTTSAPTTSRSPCWPTRRTLATLPPEEMAAGFVEVLKTALLAGGELWERVRAIDSLDPGALGDVIFDCARYKIEVVAADERDSGRRAVLNLGPHRRPRDRGRDRLRAATATARPSASACSPRCGSPAPTSCATEVARAPRRARAAGRARRGRRRRRRPRGDRPRQEGHRRGRRLRAARAPGRASLGRARSSRIGSAPPWRSCADGAPTTASRSCTASTSTSSAAATRSSTATSRCAELERKIAGCGEELGLETTFFQTNHEGEFVEHLHRLPEVADAAILNAGRLDALLVGDPRRARGIGRARVRGPHLRRRAARSGASSPSSTGWWWADLRQGRGGLPRGARAARQAPGGRLSAPTAAERRGARLAELVAEARARPAFVSDLTNVRYLTGFTGTNGACLVGPERPHLLHRLPLHRARRARGGGGLGAPGRRARAAAPDRQADEGPRRLRGRQAQRPPAQQTRN